MKMIQKFLFFLVVLVLSLHVSGSNTCPQVFDGLTNGQFDLSTQFSTSSIAANWAGLSNSDVISYEWAIISEAKYSSKLSEPCRRVQGFNGIPDVLNWVNVRKENTGSSSGLNLNIESKYYVVLRTTLADGVQLFSNSNGIKVLPQELNLRGTNSKEGAPINKNESKQLRDAPIEFEECSIDAENRCRKSQIPVRDILAQIYGPPAFLIDDIYQAGVPVVAGNDDDDDDDNSTEAGIVAGVIVGVLLLMICCLLLLGLLALLFAKGDDSGKFTENVVAKKQDHIDADHGTTTEHKLESDTRVEFPDIDPSTRLSMA